MEKNIQTIIDATRKGLAARDYHFSDAGLLYWFIKMRHFIEHGYEVDEVLSEVISWIKSIDSNNDVVEEKLKDKEVIDAMHETLRNGNIPINDLYTRVVYMEAQRLKSFSSELNKDFKEMSKGYRQLDSIVSMKSFCKVLKQLVDGKYDFSKTKTEAINFLQNIVDEKGYKNIKGSIDDDGVVSVKSTDGEIDIELNIEKIIKDNNTNESIFNNFFK